jgi:phage baseplate assembly protein W
VASLKNINSPVWGLSQIGYGVIVEGIAAIRQRIDIAIRTSKGTDPLRPEFGSFVYKFADMPSNVAIPNVKKEILSALQMWCPEIVVLAVRHYFPDEYSNPHFEVTYRLKDDELVDQLLFDLREGATVSDAMSELILQASYTANPGGLRYTLKIERNGSQVFPLPNPSGFATINELFDWAQTNLFYLGKWFLTSDKVVLYMKADGVKSATMEINMVSISLFQYDFPTLNPGEVFKVNFSVNGQPAEPVLPQIFDGPGQVLAWVQTNWGKYANWAMELFGDGGPGVFTAEFSDEFAIDTTGFRLVGVSIVPGFVANLSIDKVNANTFQASFPQLNAGEFFKVVFKKDGVSVNPNVPTTYTNPADVLTHAKTYWGDLAKWAFTQDDAGNVALFGFGFTSFVGVLTITKV